MKFVSFSTQDFVRAGVLLGDGSGGSDQVVDLAHPSMREALRDTKPQMLALIDAGLAGAVVRIGAHGLAEEAKLPLTSVIADRRRCRSRGASSALRITTAMRWPSAAWRRRTNRCCS